MKKSDGMSSAGVAAAETADWNSDDAYCGMRAAGRSALAWELIRRDPEYAAAAHAASTILPGAAPDDFVDRWGLYFRRRPRSVV
ncbi:MAG: DUF6499 domain-containing protein [Pseudomonadota bacterium]|nr:DUF6499 domain-containing protein [Pseudomonadota bacterium]